MDSTFDGLQLNQKLREKAGQTIAQRMTPLAGIYSVIFCAMFVGTMMAPKKWALAQGFSVSVFILSIILFATTFFAQKEQSKTLTRSLFYFEVLLLGAAWGGVCAYVQYTTPLGWTNFIVILMTLFVSASQMASLIPNFRFLTLFQTVLLAPSIVVNYYNIGGTQGYMIGSFFAGFLAVFLVLGWIQFLQYWKSSQAHERIEAIVDGMPGTLAWVNSDQRFLRINPRMSDLLEIKGDAEQSQTFSQAPKSVREYLTGLFENKEDRVSGLIEKDRKKFFLTAQKYNHSAEAIVLGIDVTDQHLVQEQLEFQRAQSQSSARYAGLGEVVSAITKDLPAQLDESNQTMKTVWPILHRLMNSQHAPSGKVNLVDMVQEAKEFFELKASSMGVELSLKMPEEPVFAKAHVGDVLLALLNLVNNAFDIASSSSNKKVEIELKVENGSKVITVTDHGPGVPDYLEEVIFEPNFTTKEAQGSTGLGLSLSKQLIVENNGTLQLTSLKEPTTFQIELSDT